MATSRSGNNSTKSSSVEVLTEIDWNGLFDEPDDPGDTVIEIAEQTGKPVETIRGWVEREVLAGRLIKGQAIRTTSAGRRVVQNVYRPVG